MKEHFFKNTTYYRTNEFKKDSPTLVFIHGVSGSSSAWLPYEKIFETKYNILTYDIRGHGKSKKFLHYADYEMKNFAEDLDELVSYLNIQKFVLISHSFSTLIAGEYIKLFRAKVIAIVFLSPMLGLEKRFTAKILRPILALSKILNLLPFNPKLGHHVDYTKHLNTTDLDIRRSYADVSNTTLRIYLYCLRQSYLKKQEYLLEKIGVPTLIVHGVNDTLAPIENSVSVSKKIKNAELVTIPNTNHIVVLNNLKEVSGAMESFIQRNREIV